MFSKACEYAIRATTQIMLSSIKGEKIGLKNIAEKIDSPEAFTAKILQQLNKAAIISSAKGPNGGFFVPEASFKNLNLAEIVKLYEGDEFFTACGLGLKNCSEKNPCPLHHSFKKIRNNLKTLIENTSIYDLAVETEKGNSFLKINN